jgi:endonuclease I
MRSLPLLPFLFASGTLLAQPPAGYYDAAEGLSGEALRQALHDIIDDHTVLANSALWDAFYQTDRKPDNSVWDIYSDVPGGIPPYTFQFVTDQCGGYQEEGDCFNREHSFPQSWFNDQPAPRTDLFHIYPTDGYVNQRRGNWPYGEVGNDVSYTTANGAKLGQCIHPGCSGLVFEPIEEYKGDLARGYFYMLTRYMDDAEGWTSAPVLENGEFLPWVKALLLEWHTADPVSTKEVQRNNRIHADYQGNRNPYIDNPQWAVAIWGGTAGIEESRTSAIHTWWNGGVLRFDRGERTTPATLRVVDAAGSMVHEQRITGAQGSVELPVAPGVYLVVIDGAEHTVQRIVR